MHFLLPAFNFTHSHSGFICGNTACATGEEPGEEIFNRVIKPHTENLKFRLRILHD